MYARTRNRTSGRAPAALLSLCLGLATACSDEPEPTPSMPDAGPSGIEIPLGTSLPPLEYTFTLTYGDEQRLIIRPETISGHLYLDVAADGRVSGELSTLRLGTVNLTEIRGHVQGTEIVFVEGSIGIGSYAELGLDEFRIILLDSDGDGAADGAAGEASGPWTAVMGDIFEESSHTSVLTAGLDTTATAASLDVPRNYPTILPYDAVHVEFEEPLREADVRDNLRILANGAPVTGELTLEAKGGLVIGATFQPDAFLPFDAEMTLDLGALKDPAGNALTAADASVPVMADPGVFTDNAGFESNLDGWIVFGDASAQGAFEGFAPAEGVAQAVLREDTMLVTRLEVPADATALDFSIAVLNYQPDLLANYTTVIGLRRPGGELIQVFDVSDFADRLQPCTTCTEFANVVGPLRHTLDLTPYRGQSVFLTVDARAIHFIGVEPLAVLLDDIQVR
jgi:hypothetical protein